MKADGLTDHMDGFDTNTFALWPQDLAIAFYIDKPISSI